MRGQQAANQFEVWIAQAPSLHGHRVCHGRENAIRTIVEFSPEMNVFSYVWVALICGGMEGTLLLHLARWCSAIVGLPERLRILSQKRPPGFSPKHAVLPGKSGAPNPVGRGGRFWGSLT